MQPKVKLTQDDSPETPDPKEQKFYRSTAAKVQFVAHWIRFDVSYPAAQSAWFCASAGVWAVLYHLMGYLEHNPSFKLIYSAGHVSGLNGYADSVWGNSACRRSTTGILARYNKAIVLWRSKLQKTISLSTAEAEYYGMGKPHHWRTRAC